MTHIEESRNDRKQRAVKTRANSFRALNLKLYKLHYLLKNAQYLLSKQCGNCQIMLAIMSTATAGGAASIPSVSVLPMTPIPSVSASFVTKY